MGEGSCVRGHVYGRVHVGGACAATITVHN